MKQRIKIKQYKKELSKDIDFVTKSFEYYIKHNTFLDNTSLKIYHEYFKDLEVLSNILKNKQLHVIKSLIKDENNKFVTTFVDVLSCIEGMYEVAFDDKEIYNYSNLLR